MTVTRLTILASSILFAAANLAVADDIKALPYSYSYGDSVSATNDDSFLMCGDCRSDKLEKLPKQYVAIKMNPTVQAEPLHQVELAQINKHEDRPEATCGPNCHLGDIHFLLDKADLQPAELRKLDKIISSIPPKAQVSVSGYTCTIGTKRHNQKLSERRAIKVAAYLRNNGVQVAIVEGKGECCSVSENKKTNRRVEIIEKGKVTTNE